MHCPFCQLPPERILHSNAHALVIRDGYPVTPGHTLIIPKRHTGSFFETTPEERNALFELLDWAKAELEGLQLPNLKHTNSSPFEKGTNTPSFSKGTEPTSFEKNTNSPLFDKSPNSPNFEKSPDSPPFEKSPNSPNFEKSTDSPNFEKSTYSPLFEKGGQGGFPNPTPNAYNIGINDGPAAGQTVPHLHIHLIPRYTGDSPDPRGGVRWIMPEKAKYW